MTIKKKDSAAIIPAKALQLLAIEKRKSHSLVNLTNVLLWRANIIIYLMRWPSKNVPLWNLNICSVHIYYYFLFTLTYLQKIIILYHNKIVPVVLFYTTTIIVDNIYNNWASKTIVNKIFLINRLFTFITTKNCM